MHKMQNIYASGTGNPNALDIGWRPKVSRTRRIDSFVRAKLAIEQNNFWFKL